MAASPFFDLISLYLRHACFWATLSTTPSFTTSAPPLSWVPTHKDLSSLVLAVLLSSLHPTHPTHPTHTSCKGPVGVTTDTSPTFPTTNITQLIQAGEKKITLLKSPSDDNKINSTGNIVHILLALLTGGTSSITGTGTGTGIVNLPSYTHTNTTNRMITIQLFHHIINSNQLPTSQKNILEIYLYKYIHRSLQYTPTTNITTNTNIYDSSIHIDNIIQCFQLYSHILISNHLNGWTSPATSEGTGIDNNTSLSIPELLTLLYNNYHTHIHGIYMIICIIRFIGLIAVYNHPYYHTHIQSYKPITGTGTGIRSGIYRDNDALSTACDEYDTHTTTSNTHTNIHTNSKSTQVSPYIRKLFVIISSSDGCINLLLRIMTLLSTSLETHLSHRYDTADAVHKHTTTTSTTPTTNTNNNKQTNNTYNTNNSYDSNNSNSNDDAALLSYQLNYMTIFVLLLILNQSEQSIAVTKQSTYITNILHILNTNITTITSILKREGEGQTGTDGTKPENPENRALVKLLRVTINLNQILSGRII